MALWSIVETSSLAWRESQKGIVLQIGFVRRNGRLYFEIATTRWDEVPQFAGRTPVSTDGNTGV